MRPSPTRHRIAVAIALVGIALAAVTLVVSQRLAGEAGYTSFCNLGSTVNCDAVLTSRYSKFLGVSVSAWGITAFALGALLALPGAIGGTSAVADLALLAVASGSLGFAAVLGVAMASLGHLCLLCASLDLTIVAWFVTVVPLAARFQAAPGGRWWQGRDVARAAVAASVVLAVAGATLAAVRTPAPVTTVGEVEAQDPDFYHWYVKHPVGDESGPQAFAIGYRKGPADAPVCIVEFSDFECPHCAQAFRDLRDLVRARPDVSVVFRHFPLDPSCNALVQGGRHRNACLAACAAECADQQGRFWEYHDVLFENQEHLERESLFRYARDMRLDLGAFRTCLDDPATRARIGVDVEAGARVGVRQTPTLVINGRTIPGALDTPVHYQYAVIIERQSRDVPGPEGAS
jgi:protein-disulfide isomerase/uncharacterized membrane protein